MAKSQARWIRALAYGTSSMLLFMACQGATQPTASPASGASSAPASNAPSVAPSQAPSVGATNAPSAEVTNPPSAEVTQEPTAEVTTAPSEGTGIVKGGTLHMFKFSPETGGFDQLDPQRIYTGEDLAFFGATIFRSLTAYKHSTDPVEGTSLVPDAATDTGTHNDDATSWSFTLKDGIKWQDGSAVTCEDFKYGVSRTFATDIITNGPTYVINYLDIPANDDGSSQYPGPYTATEDQQALFDAAVTCDGNTITYNLKQPVADFNYTVTLGMTAVPNPVDHPGVDTKEAYTTAPWSDGPYMIDPAQTDLSVGGKLTLVRNPNWDAATDDYRAAAPDVWQVDFLGDAAVEDQRLMASEGEDANAVQYGAIQPENLGTIFSDSHTTNPDFEGRAFSDYDPYSRYYWINLNKVPDLNVRQAMAVALNRDAIRTNIGGEFAGDFADGVIKPNIGQDYAPTNLWTASGPYGVDVPATGDPAKAAELLGDTPPPTLTFDYAKSPTGDKSAAIIKDSLEQAGFKIKLNALDPTNYYSTVFDPELQDEFGTAGWGPDWPNASTVIPPLFTESGGFDLSRVSADTDPDFTAAVTDALGTLDRAEQASKWQELNKQAAEKVFVIPTFFGLAQTMAGNNVGNLYRWSAYGSWDYAQLYVKSQ